MSYTQYIGAAILLVMFAGLVYVTGLTVGWREAAIMWPIIFGLTGLVVLAATLLVGTWP